MATPIETAIKIAGSTRELSRQIGVSQASVMYYKRSGPPPEKAIAIEKATGVSRKLLRPDIFQGPR